MPEDKSSISMAALLQWLPLILALVGAILWFGRKDTTVDVLDSRQSEMRTTQSEMWKQIRQNTADLIKAEAKIEFLERERDQEHQVREQRR